MKEFSFLYSLLDSDQHCPFLIDTTAAPKSSSKNEATEKEIFTRRQEPAVQKNRIVIHDLDDEESEAEIQIHPDTEPSVKNKSSEKGKAW